MSTTQHTPGPWRVDQTKALGAYGVWTEHPAPPVQICSVRGQQMDLPRETIDANARLIAAAPDLLEALVLAEDRLSREGTGSNETWAAIDKARAAIRKATGETA